MVPVRTIGFVTGHPAERRIVDERGQRLQGLTPAAARNRKMLFRTNDHGAIQEDAWQRADAC